MGSKTKLALIFLCCFIIFGSYGYLTFWYYFYYKTDDLPDVTMLLNYDLKLTSVVYDDSGNPIDKFSVEDKIFISFKNLPEMIINAIVAAEDKNFFSKRLILGIDPLGILRALVDNMLATADASWQYLKISKGLKIEFETVSGGSTITQQIARQIWLTNERTLKRKILEARIAYQMEKYLSKELIFEIYINSVYFGHSKYGIVTASKFYFSKTLAELTTDEAAMLAGIIKWPIHFSPITDKKSALNRRNTILRRMLNNKFISLNEFNNLRAKSITVNVKNGDSKIPYFSSFIMKRLHDLGYTKIVNNGLQIHTSINSSIQQIAENALEDGLISYDKRHQKRLVLYNIFSDYDFKSFIDFDSDSWHGDLGIGSVVDGLVLDVEASRAIVKVRREKYPEYIYLTPETFLKIHKDTEDLTKVFKIGDVLSLLITGVDAERQFTAEIIQPKVQGAVIVLDVETGAIKAIVGGRDFNVNQYNRAIQAERQAGSSFKPFVFGAYFEKYPDKDLNSIILDSPICFKTGNPKKPKWCPKNYEEKSLPRFMGPISIKTAIARSRNVASVRAANAVGINEVVDLAHTLGISSNIPRYLPTAIGAADVKVIDMARAYAVFFRGGIDLPYWFLESVLDNNHNLANFKPSEYKQIISKEAADKVLLGMRWVVLAGTARSASRELPFAVAGKTGTTNGFTDTWFVGGTSKYVVAVWVGFDRKAIPLVSRENSFKETGGSTALPVFIDIMKGIYQTRPYDEFSLEINTPE